MSVKISALQKRNSILDPVTNTARKEYIQLKESWKLKVTPVMEETLHMIDKDVTRTDHAAPFYNQNQNDLGWNENMQKLRNVLMTYAWCRDPEVGYVQGMGDLASLILMVNQGSESMSYWCFTHFMDRVKVNFSHDGRGMKRNLELLQDVIQTLDPGLAAHLKVTDSFHLFFSFRWILVCFRREFDIESVCILWDALLSRHQTDDWLVFFAGGILLEHRDAIVRHLITFDEVFKVRFSQI